MTRLATIALLALIPLAALWLALTADCGLTPTED